MHSHLHTPENASSSTPSLSLSIYPNEYNIKVTESN